jgi:hypothetical protein
LLPGAVDGTFPDTCYSFYDKKEKCVKWVSDCDEVTQALDDLGRKYHLIISLGGKKGLWINVKAKNPNAKAPSTQKVLKVCAEVLSFMMKTSAPSCTGFTFRKPLSREEQEKKRTSKMEESQPALEEQPAKVLESTTPPTSFASAAAKPASAEALLAPAPRKKPLVSQLDRLRKFSKYLGSLEEALDKLE